MKKRKKKDEFVSFVITPFCHDEFFSEKKEEECLNDNDGDSSEAEVAYFEWL